MPAHRLPVILLLALMAALIPADAQRHSSIRKRLRPLDEAVRVPDAVSLPDTVAADSGMVIFSGYEKTLRSTRETVFLTNRSGRLIEGIVFRITYLDSSGRMLHEARRVSHAGVPPGETRRLDFPSWDRQCTFYYSRSPRPRVPAIPYDVCIMPDTLFLAPHP